MLGQCIQHWQQIATHSTSTYHQQRHHVWLQRLERALRDSPQATIALLNRYATQEHQRSSQPARMARRAADGLKHVQPHWQRLKRR